MRVENREHDKILYSDEDSSINRVRHIDLSKGESIETRIVQRNPDTMIIYLSSAKSCHLSCRMCFLTQTKQTNKTPIELIDIEDQMDWVVNQLENDTRIFQVDNVHVNMMSRGDFLSNPYLVKNYKEFQKIVKDRLDIIFNTDCTVKFKISTIFPLDFIYAEDPLKIKKWVDEITTTNEYGETEIYYSLYSLKQSFRKKWLPKAMNPRYVGELFRGHRPEGNISKFRLHHALIDFGNDYKSDVDDIHTWLKSYDIHCVVNLVQYNPYDSSCGVESDNTTTEHYVNELSKSENVTLVQRVKPVAKDVMASCGMFTSEHLV